MARRRWPSGGARFRGINTHAKVGQWESTSVVTRYEPDAVFEWAVGDTDHPAARWRFSLEPTDAGARRDAGPAMSLSIGITPPGLDQASLAFVRDAERVGASGPQVMEGWHGVRFARPVTRTRETIEIIRTISAGERLTYDGTEYTLPLPKLR